MNIFYVDKDPRVAARMLCDSHVSKMTLESAQMLSTAHRVLDGTPEMRPSKSGKRMVKYWKIYDWREDHLYNAVHVNHPCTQWIMKTTANYKWLYQHFIALGDEFLYRYGKHHGSDLALRNVVYSTPANLKSGSLTPPALAMKAYPECIVEGDPVASYRNFYVVDKSDFAKWDRGRSAPEWWTEPFSIMA